VLFLIVNSGHHVRWTSSFVSSKVGVLSVISGQKESYNNNKLNYSMSPPSINTDKTRILRRNMNRDAPTKKERDRENKGALALKPETKKLLY